MDNNLCCGCGICKGICPRNCISWERKNGLFLPVIDADACVNCGLCASVCPGLGHSYEPRKTATETVTGMVLECCNAWSKDAELRHVSASGGVISTIIQKLLASDSYDGAFCLDSYDYREQLKTRLFTADEVAARWEASSAPKSRYLPVSHENAVRYMKENRDKRLILIGTSCAIRGLQAAVKKLNLKRDQYLFIGLFCDKVFNYNVLAYFSNIYAQGHTVEALHFKNKESGGWPGDMKFFLESGEAFYVPLEERAKAKAYFMPERCLYCVDKLNACADISLGDNYTGKDDSPLGSNSVIIRTETGMAAWSAVQDCLEIRSIGITNIQKAQAIDWRLRNLYIGDLAMCEFDLNSGIPREMDCTIFKDAYRIARKKLNTGAVYAEDSTALARQVEKDGRKANLFVRWIKRIIGFVRRRIKMIG